MLRELPNISFVCKRIPVAKATVYRWREKDPKFRAKMDEALTVGRDGVTDLAESQLIVRIRKGDMRAVQYWLDNNCKRYIKPRAPLSRDPGYRGVTKFNISLYSGKKKTAYSQEADEKPTRDG